LEWRFRDKESLEIMARMKKSEKKWMWVAKPGDKIVVSRTAVIPQRSYLEENSEHWKRS
jgi:hypothetical protein